MQGDAIKIGDSTIQWTAANGESLRMEMGIATVGGLSSSNIKFEREFASPPNVFITITNADAFGRRFGSSYGTRDVEASGFELVSSSGDTADVQWLAIGK